MIEDSQELGLFLAAAAASSRLNLARDTHYDADNWELSWWQGKVLNRLDFQFLDGSRLAVTHLRDRFRLLPRVLRSAHKRIPMFPYLARTEQLCSECVQVPVDESRIDGMIGGALGRQVGGRRGAPLTALGEFDFWAEVEKRRDIFFWVSAGWLAAGIPLFFLFRFLLGRANEGLAATAALLAWGAVWMGARRHLTSILCVRCGEKAIQHPFFFMKDARCAGCGYRKSNA